MRTIIILITALVLIASCAKEELNGFDSKIQFAQDLKIDPATGDTIYSLFMPSGFTPNGDGLNDLYYVQGSGIDPESFEMSVCSREGNIIHYTEDPYSSFDGHVMGYSIINASGVYTIKLIVTDTTGEEHRYLYDIFQCN